MSRKHTKLFAALFITVLFAALAITDTVFAVNINPGLSSLSSTRYAKVYTLENKRYYGGYSSYGSNYGYLYYDDNFSQPRSYSAWTGEDDEIWITRVGVNSRNIAFAEIKYPVGNSRITAYVRLDILIGGNLTGSARTANSKYYGLYRRKADGYVRLEYGIDAGDTVYLLAQSGGWCQVLYPTGSSGVWRVAWMTESSYNGLFNSGNNSITRGETTTSRGNYSRVATNSTAREKVADYAYKILNEKWTTNSSIRRWKGSPAATTGTIYGVPYSYGGGNTSNILSFAAWKNLPLSSKEKIVYNSNYGVYEMQYGMVCASLVTDCIMQGFPDAAGLNLDHEINFNKRGKYPNWVSAGSASYESYANLQKGDYVRNNEHVMLVIENYPASNQIKFIHQTSCAYINDHSRVGTVEATRSYDDLLKNGYRAMFVDYPVPINSQTFPDYNFRQFVKNNYDKNNDELLSGKEIEAVTSMTHVNCRFGSFEGIKYFNNLKTLKIHHTSLFRRLLTIKTIDLSGMTSLEEVEIYNSPITSLNVSNCTSLRKLDCHSNALTGLNLSTCQSLEILNCSYNNIKQLNIISSYLREVNCSNNQINNIKMTSASPAKIDCSNNALPYLVMSETVKSTSNISSFKCKGQSVSASYTINKSSFYKYNINLKNIIGSRRLNYAVNLRGYRRSNTLLFSYSYSTGLMKFAILPEQVKYNFITGSGTMDVTVSIQ